MVVSEKELKQSLTARKRALVVLNKGDIASTQGRVLRFIYHLSKAHYDIDVLVQNEEVYEQVKQSFSENQHVHSLYQKGKPIYWEPQRRDDFVKIFIQQCHDLIIPGTSLPYWKTAAFDDFRGHISSHVYQDIGTDYDLALVSIPSSEEPMANEADILATTVLFHAKEHNIKVVGMQIYPAEHCPRVYANVLDHIIVRNESEKRHYCEQGVSSDAVHVLDDPCENYCLDTIENTYNNMIYDPTIEIASDELLVLVLNHAKYRAQMRQVIDVLGTMDFKKRVCFGKAGYEIRDLSEDQIFDELIRPSLEKLNQDYYITDASALAKMLMLCDVIVTSTYLSPVKFASDYHKGAIIFNPIRCQDHEQDGIVYCSSEQSLRAALQKIYEAKCKRNTIASIFEEIVR